MVLMITSVMDVVTFSVSSRHDITAYKMFILTIFMTWLSPYTDKHVIRLPQ